MPVILIDENMEGQGRRIWMRLQAAEWRDLAVALDLSFRSFREVGLDPASSDDAVWQFCQSQGYYLLTSNRNDDSGQSLEAAIRRGTTATTLPVFTLPQPDRVNQTPFLDQVVESLLEYLLDADNIRGAGRIYLP